LQQTSGQGTSLFFLTWPHWLNLSCPSLLPGANPNLLGFTEQGYLLQNSSTRPKGKKALSWRLKEYFNVWNMVTEFGKEFWSQWFSF
jgi:hypothetical protein